jgi:hypothetical protein
VRKTPGIFVLSSLESPMEQTSRKPRAIETAGIKTMPGTAVFRPPEIAWDPIQEKMIEITSPPMRDIWKLNFSFFSFTLTENHRFQIVFQKIRISSFSKGVLPMSISNKIFDVSGEYPDIF